MIFSNRTIVVPALLGILATGLGSFAQSQTPASPEASRKMITISGSVGLAGVIMTGLPGRAVTDPDGSYQVQVPYGWSGAVTPVKEGFVFEPPIRTYEALSRDAASQDYKAPVIVFTISGSVGLPDVVMRGLPDDPTTGPDGSYRVHVPYGWAGVVTPSKQGYEFEPSSRDYPPFVKDRKDQNYAAREITFTISDTITAGDEPIQGVRVTGEPGGFSGVTDANGKYTVQVPYGWSGGLTLSKEGMEFDPPSIAYNSVTSDIIDGRPVPPSGGAARYGSGMGRRSPRAVGAESAGNVLIIPTRAVTPQQFAQIAEDMRVMLNILHEKLSEPRPIGGMLPNYGDFFAGADGAVEALYIQRYAAIFMLKADFPLSAPASQDQPEPQQAEPADPVWQRARDRLYAPQNPTRYGARGLPSQADERSFDQFKEDLIKAFKHAANIRGMDPNDLVILTVTRQGEPAFPGGYSGGSGGGGWVEGGGYGGGGFGGSGGFSGTGSYNFSGGGGGFQMDSRPQPGRGSTGRRVAPRAAPGSATVLTLQAKKVEVDAFAKGTLSFEQFQQRVKVFTY
jgi:uncharacterized membrane protein YgcG